MDPGLDRLEKKTENQIDAVRDELRDLRSGLASCREFMVVFNAQEGRVSWKTIAAVLAVTGAMWGLFGTLFIGRIETIATIRAKKVVSEYRESTDSRIAAQWESIRRLSNTRPDSKTDPQDYPRRER